jgi:hypothetical protein
MSAISSERYWSSAFIVFRVDIDLASIEQLLNYCFLSVPRSPYQWSPATVVFRVDIDLFSV